MYDVSIKELALHAVEAMLEAGFTNYSAWNEYETSYAPIVRLHNQRGQDNLNQETVSEYVRMVKARYDHNEIGYGQYRRLTHGAERLMEFHDIGRIKWSKSVVRLRLTEYYEAILEEILSYRDWKVNMRKYVQIYAKRYFSWLIQSGHQGLDSVNAEVVRQYIIYCSRRMKGSGLRSTKYYLKKLYSYLKESGRLTDKYEAIFEFPVPLERKIQQAVSQEEIASILNAIDRSTPIGKRDYAIILLGAVTGLRASDICKIKLTDIDWRNGEIRIIQEKTNKPLMLPLTKDIGEAVGDYILNARAKCGAENIFLRVKAPIKEFAGGNIITSIYESARKKAGLEPYGGFHSLRRTLGRNMVTSGVPVTMVAQVLGHTDIDSTKQYISLDSKHLKECALDFTDIEPERNDAC